MRDVTEIRMRINQPLLMVLTSRDIMFNSSGETVNDINKAYRCSREDLIQVMQLVSKNSLYAFEQELRMGYFTIIGGHRIGVAGQAIMENGQVKALKNISSINIRIAREVKGCADPLMTYILGKRIASTLLISPPRCGKTTILRDIIRQLSSGSNYKSFNGVQIGLVDERSEIAACQHGIPTMDLGHRVDVLDGCPKASGMLMLIRSMAPQAIITDELGRHEDVQAVREALNAGISVITTVHGNDEKEILHRPYVSELIKNRFFDRYIILDNQPKIGTIKKVVAVKEDKILYSYNEKEQDHVVETSR
nr:stage III sporulation protein AA [Propionispora sp. 2/2-37]